MKKSKKEIARTLFGGDENLSVLLSMCFVFYKLVLRKITLNNIPDDTESRSLLQDTIDSYRISIRSFCRVFGHDVMFSESYPDKILIYTRNSRDRDLYFRVDCYTSEVIEEI